MRKKILSIILSLAMVLTMIPAMGSVAYAAGSDQEITYNELYEANSLTLSGGNKYVFNKGMKISGDLEIKDCEVDIPSGGIEVTSGNISIDNANVTITRNDTYNYGIYAKDGTLDIINGSTVQVVLRDKSYNAIEVKKKINAANSNIGIIVDKTGNGISCSSDTDSDIGFDNCRIEIYTPKGYGISAYRGSLTMSNSKATFDCGNTGLSCHKSMELNNCTLTVAAGKEKSLAGGQPDAIFASDSVVIDGGSITASSIYNSAIYANNNVTITNNTDYVSASGAEYGIKAGDEKPEATITIGDALVISEPANGKYNADGGYIEDAKGNPAAKVVIQSDGAIKVLKPVYKGDITEDGKTHYMYDFYDLSGLPADTMFRITVEGGYALINLDDLYSLSGIDPVADSFTIVLPESYVFEDGTNQLLCPFRILSARKPAVKLKNDVTSYQYSGKVIKPTISAKCGSDVLQKGVDYDVIFPSGCKSVGKYTVKVNFKGIYQGSSNVIFKIIPATASIKSIAVGKKKMTVKMTTKPSSKGASTYQIYYKQKGTSKWKSTTTTSQSKTIKKLKKGKRYYVKVRAYKKVGTETYYGAWSKTKLSKKIK